MPVYDKRALVKKVDALFDDLKQQSDGILAAYPDIPSSSKMIMDTVSSETSIRSKTILTDMIAQLSEQTLSLPVFDDAERKCQFYEANIRGNLLSAYQFHVTSIHAFEGGIPFKEIHRLYASAGVAAGTAAIGGIVKYALESAVTIPLAAIIAGAIAAFCVSYFKVMPASNLSAFRKAVEVFLADVKKEFISWFDKIEIYYNNYVDNLIATF